MTKAYHLPSHMAQVKTIECITPNAKKHSICRKWLSYTVCYPQFWYLGCWFCFERWVGSTPHFRDLEFWHPKLQVDQLYLSLKLLIWFKCISRLVFKLQIARIDYMFTWFDMNDCIVWFHQHIYKIIYIKFQ